jgi:hypothetical protein
VELDRCVRIAITPRSRGVLPVPIYVYARIARDWSDCKEGNSKATSISFSWNSVFEKYNLRKASVS